MGLLKLEMCLSVVGSGKGMIAFNALTNLSECIFCIAFVSLICLVLSETELRFQLLLR